MPVRLEKMGFSYSLVRAVCTTAEFFTGAYLFLIEVVHSGIDTSISGLLCETQYAELLSFMLNV